MSGSDAWKKKAAEADEMRCPECLMDTDITKPKNEPQAVPIMIKCENCGHRITKDEIAAWFSIGADL